MTGDLVDLRCYREVAFHHHIEVSDGWRRFHIDIADVEGTVLYLVDASRGSASQELCL